TTRDVDDVHTLAHPGECGRVEEVTCPCGRGGGKHDVVRVRKQRVEGTNDLHTLDRAGRVGSPHRSHAHAEGEGTRRDRAADPTEADERERRALDTIERRIREVPVRRRLVEIRLLQALRVREDRSHHPLGDRYRAGAAGTGYDPAVEELLRDTVDARSRDLHPL